MKKRKKEKKNLPELVAWLDGIRVKVHMAAYVTVHLFVYTCTGCRRVSHTRGALVPRIGGGHGHGAAASLGHAGALEHAGMEARVSPGVLSQVVAPHEALLAHGTVEALLARVCAVVTRQLVRPGELLAAIRPGALEGTLT